MKVRAPLALLLATLLLAACGSDGGGGGTPATPADADGDGLTDAEEATWGTSPLLADTDGDGYGDLEELVQYGFDPVNNNFKFNPLVSDLPRLGIYFTTLPKVTLLYTRTDGTTKEFTTNHERGLASSQSTSQSTSNSTASEFSQSVGAEVSASVEVGTGGVSGTASVSASYNATWSTTSEQTVTYGAEQTQESSQTWSEGQAFGQSADVSFSGGTLALAVNVVNEGTLAFELQSLALGMVTVSPGGERTLNPVGNLVYDGAAFPSMTLGPGQSSTSLIFTKKDLDLGTAQALLADSTGLIVKISSYELTDAAGLGFNHRLTEVNARTAQVVIDYAGKEDRGVERYNVATNSDPGSLHITAARALEILRIPFAVDGAKRLSSVRGLSNDESLRRYWNVVHVSSDGVSQSIETLRETGAWDFDGLTLKSGDVLHLILMEDADGDGIGIRQEFAYGTRDDSQDLDADGLSDRDEAILYGMNPQRPDTDLDGKRDSSEVFTWASIGTGSAVAVAVDGSFWRWGDPAEGGAALQRPARVDVGGRRVVGGAACSVRTFAIAEDGGLWAWGANAIGQLGVGDFEPRPAPTLVPGGITWAWVGCGELHSLGLSRDGTLYGWGQSSTGQLGVTQAAVPAPLQIGAAGEWASVATGGSAALGIKKDGTLWTWGFDRFGQLGLPFLPGEIGAVRQVGTATDWVAGAMGNFHTIAVRADGSLWSWGTNHRGQLGRDAAETCAGDPCSRLPGQVGSSLDWALVSAGATSSLAVRANQSVWTWGDNAAGQAGYGVFGGSFDRPGVIFDLRFRQVLAGGDSVIAIDRAFRLRAWGWNGSGQLGTGDPVNRAVPTLVAQ